MKAVCLLLCLALARESAGNIFGRQHIRTDSLIVQPLETIDQAQVYQQDKEQDSQSNEHAQYQPVHSQRNKHQKQQNSVQQQQQNYDQQQQQNYEQQRQQNYRQQQSYEQLQYQQDLEQYKQQQRKQQQKRQQKNYRTQKQHHHDSTSVESNSQETQQRIYRQYVMPVSADVETLNTRLYGQNEMKPAYGDAISWRGVEIAASPRNAIQKVDIEKVFSEAYKTMEHFSAADKKIFHQAYEQAAQKVNEEGELNATELLNKHQYPVETHTIKTDDGYNLTLFRIPPKDETLQQRPVVFLMHGLLGSADDWLLMGPGKALAYLLSDAGYEVWLGNARGSKYSRRHVSKNPAQADFWQFSNDEIALHDLPAMIDYALKTSNQEKLFYVGYSQGTTAFFALASTRPEYNNKIIMMYALAPMAYMSNVRSPLLRMIAPTSQFSEKLHKQLGHGEFKPQQELMSTAGGVMCEQEIGCPNVCSNVNFVISGASVQNMDVELIPVITRHLPAGASTRQMKQYAQAVASHEFTKYDFGAEINEQVYGSRQAPKYDMSKVQTPVALYYSEEDWLAHPKDVERLQKELPRVADAYKVPEPHFSHMDFQFARNAPQVVYNRLIKSIQKQNQQTYQNNVY